MKTPWIRLGLLGSGFASVALVTGCDIGSKSHPGTGGEGGGATATAGPTGTGGTTGPGTTGPSGSTGSTGSGGGTMSTVSGLPVPPGAGGKVKPSGAAQNLKVLAWAGFTSAVTYTFDDAQPSHIQHWPELKAEGIRATFYLNTLNQSNEASFDATWQDALASGWELGNHTVHHCYSSGMCPNGGTFTTANEEFDDVDTYITATAKQAAVWTGAYPFGDTGYEPAAKSRFFLARGIYNGTVAPEASTDPYNLPCVAAIGAGGEPASKFSADVDAAHGQGSWLIFLFHTIMPTTQVWYAPTDIASITGSIDHAKSLGDVWIDTMATAGSYWMGQKLVTAATPTTAGGATTWTWTLPDHFPTGKFLRVTVDGGTLKQGGQALPWDGHGYYEVALDAGALTLAP